jgi:predicted PolB exonuclease-like 3'-5' exonuclease
MINVPLDKILFIDIETVGIESDYPTLEKKNPKLAELFSNYESWFKKRFPEDADVTLDQLFQTRTALVPEFARIVTVCLGIVDQSGKFETTVFSDENERSLLIELRKTLFKCGELGYFLCGHNVKNFDIPMMAKRMIINNILPPKIFPTYDTKPWEVKAIDTRDVWQYGQYASISTLDLMCGVMGVESSKSDEMDGSRVHEVFYKEKNIDKINTYCEKDVKVLYEVVKKLQNLL